MSKLKIITVPDPLLRQKSKPVKRLDQKVTQLAAEMIKIIKGNSRGQRIGVGLSAVQVGKLIRLFVAYSPQSKKDLVFINPKITWQSKKMTQGVPEREFPYEGCLSIPGYLGLVKRHQTIELEYQSLSGRRWKRKFTGLLATIIQHELDHLNGILFIDRVLEQKGPLYQVERNEKGEESLRPVTLVLN